MGGRCQPHDQDPSVRITKSGYRSSPIRPVSKLPALETANFLSIPDQPRTEPTLGHSLMEESQLMH
jgi:hypothetical protein